MTAASQAQITDQSMLTCALVRLTEGGPEAAGMLEPATPTVRGCSIAEVVGTAISGQQRYASIKESMSFASARMRCVFRVDLSTAKWCLHGGATRSWSEQRCSRKKNREVEVALK